MNPDQLYAKIQNFVVKESTDIANAIYEKRETPFGVSVTPYHTHNGIDSPNVSFGKLYNRILPIHWTVVGTSAATASNYGTFWTAPSACTVVGATEVHQTLGTGVGAVTLQIEKLTGTTAPDSGIELLITSFNLKANINTVQTGSIVNTTTGSAPNIVRNCTLAVGDRLCLKDNGLLTSVANVTVIITIQY